MLHITLKKSEIKFHLSLLNVCILLTFCAGDSKPNKQMLVVMETLN